MTDVRRGFVSIPEGEVHYRSAGVGDRPLVMFHMSPLSSRSLLPLLGPLAEHRRVIAPDTLGNGHSSALPMAEPDFAFFVTAHLHALDALDIRHCDLYGTHTGAKIALEIAIREPHRVGKVILDGISVRGAEDAEMLLSGIAAVAPDHDGTQVLRAWHMVRDAYLFFPWWNRTIEARRNLGLPDAAFLNGEFADLVASISTYHLVYRAAIRHSNRERLPLLRSPALVACAENDPLFVMLAEAAAMVPRARARALPPRLCDADWRDTARIFSAFLNEQDP